MEQFSNWSTYREAAMAIGAALDGASGDDLDLLTDAELLGLTENWVRLTTRVQAAAERLAARVDSRGVAERAHGTSASTWLMGAVNLTHREAARLINSGLQLDGFPLIGDAARAGLMLGPQAEAISSVLTKLPDDLPTDSALEAERLMVEFADTHNSTELRRLSAYLLECVAPEVAEQSEAARLQREYQQATRDRHLAFLHDHHGSVLIRGSLPVIDAEPFMAIIHSYVAAKRGLDRLDPAAPQTTLAMRRADALMLLTQQHAEAALAPRQAGDRPRIVVTLNYEHLVRAATGAGLISARDLVCDDLRHKPANHVDPTVGGVLCESGSAGSASNPLQVRAGSRSVASPRPVRVTDDQVNRLTARVVGTGDGVPAGVLRRLLCDADILPIVLGGDSEPLDVGRAQRLVTPPIRAALEQRDGGCVFPGCDKPPRQCHAHHLQPWWAGGSTSLANLVLLCPHHHGICEPGHDPAADRWIIELHHNQARAIPPRRVDPAQRPRTHARLLTGKRRT